MKKISIYVHIRTWWFIPGIGIVDEITPVISVNQLPLQRPRGNHQGFFTYLRAVEVNHHTYRCENRLNRKTSGIGLCSLRQPLLVSFAETEKPRFTWVYFLNLGN